MDIARPDLGRKRRLKRLIIGAGAALVVALATVGLARLEPSAPTMSRASVLVDTVREGELLRQVRGTGTLVPQEIRWIAAQTDARIDHILVRPGAAVEPQTVLVEMSDPDLLQRTAQARFELEAAEAEATEIRLRINNQKLDQHAALAEAEAEYKGARLQADAEKTLVERGIVPGIQYQRSELRAEQLQIRRDIEKERLEQFANSMNAQLAAGRARVDQMRNAHERRTEQVESLQLRAGTAGVLQQVLVAEGQRVTSGANIARVVQPDRLQAELRVAESQAREVQLGQKVKVDTRNGIVDGRVARIAPAVQAGSVLVEVELIGALPPGARPDLSVEAVIEVERVAHAVYTGRPASGQANSKLRLFKLVDAGRQAERVEVAVGRVSMNAVEITRGLKPGDQVILSDTSAWDDHERVLLR